MSVKSNLLNCAKAGLLWFWRLHKSVVKKNTRFKNKHAGETCLIFGNGGSLKYYDISQLPSFPGIGCAYTLIDDRVKRLNMKYIVSTDSYLFYPFLYNTYPFVQRFQKNGIRRIFEETIAKNPEVNFFINLTNFYARVRKYPNINYIHHFGTRNGTSHDLAGSLSTMEGALDIMLSTAKFLGFSRAILVGCDYVGAPPMLGHFYADSHPFEGEYMPEYCQRIKEVAEGIEVLAVLPEGVISKELPYASYEEYFGLGRRYFENTQFVSEAHLATLRCAAEKWQAVMEQK